MTNQIKQGHQVVIPLPKDRCLVFVGSVSKEEDSWKDWKRIASMYIEENEILSGVALGPGGVILEFKQL